MKNLIFKLIAAAALAVSLAGVGRAATVIYVGSWVPDDGVYWATNPLAYSGVGAAELLFGPGTYDISTVSDNPADINFQAWYNIIGVGPAVFAQDYFRGIEGVTHYEDVYVYDPAIDTVSAYVADFHSAGRNYAFRVEGVPDGAATVSLVGAGLLMLALLRRRFAA